MCKKTEDNEENPASSQNEDNEENPENERTGYLNTCDFDDFFVAFEVSKLDPENVKFNQDQCTICLDTLNAGPKLRKIDICDHLFHDECLTSWLSLSASCPNCKTSFSKSMIISMNRENNKQIKTSDVLRNALPAIVELPTGNSTEFGIFGTIISQNIEMSYDNY